MPLEGKGGAMSCYEWEEGSITIPASEWKKFREGVIGEWNRWREGIFKYAESLHEKVRSQRRKQGESTYCFIERVIHEKDLWARWTRRSSSFWNPGSPPIDDDKTYAAIRLLISPKGNLQRPKKKDVGIKPVSKSCTITFEDASITLSNKTRTARWSVSENNHAIDRAREHRVAAAFFRLLGEIKWTSRTGGIIVGNDEYNQDSRDAGGGGNYITGTFGKKGERDSYDYSRACGWK
jgi:hypothetical protein